ncbi:MAG: 4Fe-4S binding protein [Planctomycetaceae bacterium]|nr:4Fe-4S binding protein [Planctomycetaceae bacterium]
MGEPCQQHFKALPLASRWKLFGKKVDPQKCNRCARCAEVCSFGTIDKANMLTVTTWDTLWKNAN